MVNEHWMETYKSLISLSVEGFKFSALVNGGAAVALLAYLGNVAGKDVDPPAVGDAMIAFLLGLGACGLSMLFAYLTQLKLLGEINRTGDPKLSHAWPLWIAIALFVVSIAAFICGSLQAVSRLGGQA